MTKKQLTPTIPDWKKLNKNQLTGVNFTKRTYFDWGVAAAMEGKEPPSPSYLEEKTNCFIACYRDGYLTTKKIIEESKK